jgi:hypothetical protein
LWADVGGGARMGYFLDVGYDRYCIPDTIEESADAYIFRSHAHPLFLGALFRTP